MNAPPIRFQDQMLLDGTTVHRNSGLVEDLPLDPELIMRAYRIGGLPVMELIIERLSIQ